MSQTGSQILAADTHGAYKPGVDRIRQIFDYLAGGIANAV